MQKFILIQFILFVIIGKIYSQNEFIPGFIILNSNDTIFGKIEDEKDIYSGLFCVFKSNDTGKIIQYLPTEIKAYYLSNNRYFVSKRIITDHIEKTVFLQFLIEGELNIYKHKDTKRNVHFFAEKKILGLSELFPSFDKIVKIDNKTYMNTIKPFAGVLQMYTMDEPSFKDKINKLSDIFGNGLINLAKDYHETVCKNNDCKIYFYEY